MAGPLHEGGRACSFPGSVSSRALPGGSRTYLSGGARELMRRVLMISYYFPPLGGIGSVRAVKFARYLPEFGWDPVVITRRNGAYYRDPTLEFDERKIVRTPSLEISRTAKRMIGSALGDTRPAEIGRIMKRVRRFAARWVYRPDPQVGWYPFAL